MNESLFKNATAVIGAALADAAVAVHEINDVVLAGGGICIPYVSFFFFLISLLICIHFILLSFGNPDVESIF